MTTSSYAPEIARIAAVVDMGAREKLFTVELADGRNLGHGPGQFVMLTVPGVGEAPISVTSSPSRSNGFPQSRTRCLKHRRRCHDRSHHCYRPGKCSRGARRWN